MSTERVWDPLVRIIHWALAIIFVANRFLNEEGEDPHQRLGYVACALIGVRLFWGMFGSTHARFSEMRKQWPPVGERFEHFRQYIAGKTPRYLNHPPLAQLGMFAMWAGLLGMGATGWLMTQERFEELDWPGELHELLSNGLLLLVIAHVLGVLRESRLHGENLIASMIHGRKPR